MVELASNGMYMIGSRETLYHPDMRPNRPTLWPEERMNHYRDVVDRRVIPRVEGGPFKELFRAIRGEGPNPGSDFDYASRLTEVVLLGGLAIRAGQRLEWDAEGMRITNHTRANTYVREPARDGWDYGRDLWESFG
jgi:hypothetical protein